MKQTVNVNIGSMPFTLDEDAYQALREYFADVRSRLPEEDIETEADVETRMGEILREKVASPMYVVSLDTVRAAIARLGTPDCFGVRHDDPRNEAGSSTNRRLDKLRRSRTDRSICGGLAEHFGIDSSLLRLITLLLILFGGLSIWIYVILWIVIPEAPSQSALHDKKGRNK